MLCTDLTKLHVSHGLATFRTNPIPNHRQLKINLYLIFLIIQISKAWCFNNFCRLKWLSIPVVVDHLSLNLMYNIHSNTSIVVWRPLCSPSVIFHKLHLVLKHRDKKKLWNESCFCVNMLNLGKMLIFLLITMKSVAQSTQYVLCYRHNYGNGCYFNVMVK